MKTTAAVPAGPLRRTVTAFASLLLLAGLIAGLPAALILLAGNPLPSDVPTMDDVWATLTSPDDGTLFLDVLAVVGWLAWASFTASVLLEVAARLARRRTPAIPGLRGQQRVAAVLVAAVAAVVASPTLTSASAALVDAPPVVAAASASITAEPVARGFGPAETVEQSTQRGFGAAEGTVIHLVARGEGILDLQDRYGVPWQRIAEANYGVEQPDGRKLERGQTRIYPGWQMRIPAAAHTPAAAPKAGLGMHGEVVPPAPLGSEQPDGGPATPERAGLEYEVAQGDWMWHIADRYLGDPERYQDIATLNPQYADQHGNYPDHIEPGWTLRLPADAVDSGPSRHATGTATPVEAERPEDGGPGQPGVDHPETPAPETPAPENPAPDQPAPDQPAPDRPAPENPAPPAQEPHAPSPGTGGAIPVPPAQAEAPPAVPAPPAAPEAPGRPPPLVAEPSPAPAPPVTGFGSAPTAPAAPDGFAAGAEQHLERLAPAALASAGLLTALVFAAAGHQLRRRRQEHRQGHRFTSAPAQRLEKTLRAAQQPLDTARLEAALRHLAAGLAERAGGPPDIAGAMLDAGTVHLLLVAPCPDPPAPWQDRGDRWTLPANASLPPADPSAALAPLPTLAAVGSQAGIHLLLDLERLGFLALHGDPARTRDLLRYLAAELACHTWSDAAEVLVTGFDPQETDLLLAIGAERLRPVPSVSAAVAMLRQHAAAVRADPDHSGAVAGRRPAQVLLAATPTPADLAVLAEAQPELAELRCAVVVATTDAYPPRHGWRVTVTPDGVVHVRLPFLRASLTAAALAMEELEPLAETARAARTAPLQPVPAAPEAEPWAVAVDAAGQVRPQAAAAADPEPTAALPTGPVPPADPDLDEDLRAWQQGDTGRPRIGVLGPVIVDAAGPPPQTRRRLHAELVVYLAQRGSRGADARSLDADLWPDVPVGEPARQAILARVRQWLGTDQHGAPWLIEADGYRLAEGYLFDWHLFRRLRARGAHRGPAGIEDLRAALRLVRGVPLDGADRPRAPGTRNPYPWLAESTVHPEHLTATVVETAHELAERCLAAGDPAGARWAVRQAWLADPGRTYDQPWRDLLQAEQADGQTDQLRSVLAELMRVRQVETPEDLAPETYHLISYWPRHVLAPAG